MTTLIAETIWEYTEKPFPAYRPRVFVDHPAIQTMNQIDDTHVELTCDDATSQQIQVDGSETITSITSDG